MSDHFSGPAVMGDPAVDITDFYAFPSPERPGNLVLIMDVFPMATSQSFFSDVVTYRFRLRPLTRSGGSLVHGTAEHTIDVTFSDVPEGSSVQKGNIVTSDGREASFVRWGTVGTGWHARLRGTGQRPVLHGCRGRAPHGYFGQTVLRHGRKHRSVSRRLVDRRRGPVCSDRRTLRWHHADRRDRGEPSSRAAASRSESNVSGGRRSRTSSWQTRLAIRARRASSFAISTIAKTPSRSPRNIGHSTSRVSTRTWPSSMVSTARLRGRSEQTGAIRCAICSSDDFLILDLAHPFAPGRLSRDRTLADRQPTAQERRRSLARRRHPRRSAHAHREWWARRAARRRRRCSHQAGQPDLSLRARA